MAKKEGTQKLFAEVAPLRQAARLLVRELGVLRASGRGERISFAQGHVLVELEQQGALTASALGRLLHLNKSSTCRTLNQLLHKGWIEEALDNADPRLRPFVLTHQGRLKLNEMHASVNERVQGALQLLSPSARRTVLEGLRLYAQALQKARPASCK